MVSFLCGGTAQLDSFAAGGGWQIPRTQRHVHEHFQQHAYKVTETCAKAGKYERRQGKGTEGKRSP